MGATTIDRNTISWPDGGIGEWPVANATKIPAGVLVARNTSGYAVNGSDSASLIFAGVSEALANNTSGAAGAIRVNVRRRGVFEFAFAGSIAIANIGTAVYVSGNQTVALVGTTTHDLCCGKIVDVTADSIWVEIDGAVDGAAATS